MPGIRGLRICKECGEHVHGSRRKHYKEKHNKDIGVGNRENFFNKLPPKEKPAAPAKPTSSKKA
ncbi:MAG: hypothetical protein E6L03_10540 [Thaumarchaeota archaeon]|nr:MAG: hypothetical protein E6L03_10540 [Nitrososphaerota archaeon]